MSIEFITPDGERIYEILKEKGHSPALTDEYENEDGSLTFDMFYLSVDLHNGPGCSVCHFSFCHHCWSGNADDIPECDSPIICVEVTRAISSS
jgi:hypothetical protein